MRTEQDLIDLAMMIRRLVRHITIDDPQNKLAVQALLLLERKGIKSSPLRESS